MAKDDDLDRTTFGVLGNINPKPEAREHMKGEVGHLEDNESNAAMSGGSRHDRSEHSGSRDVTEGVTGGLHRNGRNAKLPSGHGRDGWRHRQSARIKTIHADPAELAEVLFSAALRFLRG